MAPEGASLFVKFRTNCISGNLERDNGKDIVGLRTSRLNHNCRPNAGCVYDETAHVEIVFAQRDIQPGEEICITYFNFASLDSVRPTAKMEPEAEFRYVQDMLLKKWGIVCPDDCYCKCQKTRELILEGRRICAKIEPMAGRAQTEDALAWGEKHLDILRHLNLSWTELADAHYILFQVALTRRKTLPIADRHIRKAHDIFKTIYPYSESHTKKCERLLKNPEKNANYLSADKLKRRQAP